ncbi:N-6 DNA methylase [Macrococcus equi]|uniref:N-6 DNA methylase n=1 Tax=Macrococcus equi TaxID=3395462 RepID=UPI0039BDB71B
MESSEFKKLSKDLSEFKHMVQNSWWSSNYDKIFTAILFHRIISDMTLRALERFDVFDFNSYKEIWKSDRQQEIKSVMIDEVHCILPPDLTFFHLVNELKLKPVDDDRYFIDFYEAIYKENINQPAELFFEYIFKYLDFKHDRTDNEKDVTYDVTKENVLNLNKAIIQLADVQLHTNPVMNLIALQSDFNNKRTVVMPLLHAILNAHHDVKRIMDMNLDTNLFVNYGSEVEYFADVKSNLYQVYAELFLQGVLFNNITFQKKQYFRELDLLVEKNSVDSIVSIFNNGVHWEPKPELLDDERFKGPGKLVTRNRAEWAFIQHGLYQLSNNGLMAISMSQGPLYRMANEAVVRQYLIEQENIIDTIISLPKNVGSSFRHPSCIVIFKKDRKDNDVLFIDGSIYIEQYLQNTITIDKLNEKFITLLNERASYESLSYVAQYEEIEQNNFNLNIARYLKNDKIINVEESKEIQLDDLKREIRELENNINKNLRKLKNMNRKLERDNKPSV